MPAAPEPSATLLDRLLALHPKLIDLSLGRMQRLLTALGEPQTKCPPIIHVAGTNGKGSTLAFLRAMLEADGQRVHAYSSPHLVDFHERITLAGDIISEEKLAHYLALCEAANDGQDITFFEITTAAAFCAFAAHEADYLLLEVGLGGRLDATNLVDPLLTGITPVSLDHQDFLGSEVTGIAAEKAGIMQPQRPVIVAPQPPEVADIMRQTADRVGAPLQLGGQDWQVGEEHGRLVFQDERGLLDLPLPTLAGAHQIINAGTAIALARHLPLDEAAIAAGLQNAQWPARLQKLTDGKWVNEVHARLPHADIWLDGGHNEAAATALAQWLTGQNTNRPRHVIIGLLASKAQDKFLAALTQNATTPPDHLHFVPISASAQGVAPETLQELASHIGVPSTCHASCNDAVNSIEAADALILIAGSLYLAGEVLSANRG